MADMARANLLDFDRNGMRDFFAGVGEKPWRADQVMKWIYHRLESDFGAMTDLGKSLREKLPEVAVIAPPRPLLDKASSDGTRKWLLGMDAGNAVETVYIPEPTRGTLCVSSQIGCGL
ncbi:MAG TPA: 23S rRNA (adenine(2503)-C(2))-methyltransferase RlmN, partial [Rhodanobacteraceae bacterium]|nr:23S rRNA (adenine(2503)-C(2))-methyltransferase RlmN [Rhodanobacteraceae bacterium]